VEECAPCPVFATFTLAFPSQLRKKHGKTSVSVRKPSVRLRKTLVRVQYTYYQQQPHITLWTKLYKISVTLYERQHFVHNLKLNFNKTSLPSAAEFHNYVFDNSNKLTNQIQQSLQFIT